jgi:DNA-binding MarR family transcriptional regulator
LVKNGLIYEYADEHDKRAKRVALTELGQKEVFMAFTEMHQVSEIIKGNLKESEMRSALAIFNKLTYFHQDIHRVDRNSSLEELHGKYVKP